MTFEYFSKLVKQNPNLLKNSSTVLSKKFDVTENLIKNWRNQIKLQKQIPCSEDLEAIGFRTTFSKEKDSSFKLPPKVKGYTVSSFKEGNTWYKKEEESNSITFDWDKIKHDICKNVKPIFFNTKSNICKNITTDVNSTDSEKIFWISDVHCGMKSKLSNIDNREWNEDFMNQRFLEILNNTDNCVSVTIAFLGDGIDGLDNYTVSRSHRLPQNMNNQEQILKLVNAFKRLFDGLVNQVKEGKINNINFCSVYESNHSGDMDYVVCKFLEMWLEAKYPDINVYPSLGLIDSFSVFGYNFFYCHGKQAQNQKFGLPLTLNEKTEIYLTQQLNMFNNPEKLNIFSLNPRKNIFVSGDLHTKAFSQGKFFQYYKVPAICPTSDWVRANFGESVPGIQYFNVFSSKIEEGVIYFSD